VIIKARTTTIYNKQFDLTVVTVSKEATMEVDYRDAVLLVASLMVLTIYSSTTSQSIAGGGRST